MSDKVKKSSDELRKNQLTKVIKETSELLKDGEYAVIEFTVRNGVITNSATRKTDTEWC
jgi:hypothetical protein